MQSGGWLRLSTEPFLGALDGKIGCPVTMEGRPILAEAGSGQ